MPLRSSTALTDNFQIKRFRREKSHIAARAVFRWTTGS